MIITLFNIPGACPGEILNKSIYELKTYNFIAATRVDTEIHGTQIEVNVDQSAAWLSTPNLIGIEANDDLNVLDTFTCLYYVDEIMQLSTLTTSPCYYIKATLAAAQTFVSNTAYFTQRRWELTRYSANDNDSYVGNGEAIDGLYRVLRTAAGNYELGTDINDYAVVVTAYSHVLYNAADRLAVWTAGIESSDPQSYALVDQHDHSVIATGTDALTLAAQLLAWNEVRPFVYRIQLVPLSLVNLMKTTMIYRFAEPAPGTIELYGNVLKSYEHNTAALTVSFSNLITSGISNLKSYGNPYITLEYAGQVLVRLPAFSSTTATHQWSFTRAYLGVTCEMGVNAYIRIKQDNVSVALTSFPLPEIIGSGDTSNKWYEQTGRNMITQAWISAGLAVVGGVSAMVSGGAAVPVLVGLATSQAAAAETTMMNYNTGLQAAKQTLESVGGGAANFYAMSSYTAKLEAFVEGYAPADAQRRETYFRRNGYAGLWAFSSLPLASAPRSYYWHAAGSGRLALTPACRIDTPVENNELVEAVNAEFSQGVTIWESSIGDYSVGNASV